MTGAAIAVSLYLLFPSLDPMQAELTKAMVHDEYVIQDVMFEQNMVARNYLEVFPEADDLNEPFFPEGTSDAYLDAQQKWVLESLENPIFDTMSEGLAFVAGLTENGRPVSEIVYLNSKNRLRQFEYGRENMSINMLPDNTTSVVNVNDDVISLVDYDEEYRLKEKTVWKNSASSLSEMNMISRSRYAYKKNGDKSELDHVTEEAFVGSLQTETVYDSNLNPIIIKKYEVKNKNKKLVKQINRSFDKERRITSEEEINYGKNPGRKKNVFRYTKKADLPDYDFYEDGVLRIRDVYESNKIYTETIYFDEDYSVRTRYVNGEKVLEQYFLGELEFKRKEYEDQ